MSENYIVNYDINVNSQKGLEAILKFQEATMKLDECSKKLLAFQKKIDQVSAKFSAMSRKAPVFDISTSAANRKLDAVITRLEKIHRLAKQVSVLNVGGSAGAKVVSSGGGKSVPRVIPGTPNNKVSSKRIIPKNIGYRNFGPTMIDSGGVGAFDFMKGMGIAYGITGLGNLMGGALRDATEYDIIIKTTENILKTHDKLPGFVRRFSEMEQIVRNVGIETKFTAPQVADASRFLAMAGFDLNAINKSIRPIADIALVGDTDLGTTADVVTNIMTGFGISPDKITRAADVMTMTFTKTNTTLMEIAEAYKYSASLLAAAGMPFETATAAFGILGDAGIKGSQAGTTMRTILANLVHPTNKQQAKWEEIGVKRTDKNGNTRSIVDVFRDLNNANIKVADYYGIFHKTAAQGAVSLANNVDKWNEVIFQNFLSDNLAHKLAEEKKNTIQGLWYQLTSSFTEDGMQAFEELQQPIKNMLNQTISWLKAPEAIESMKNISRNMLDFMTMLKDIAISAANIYQKFSGIINAWLKLQIWIFPFLTAVRSVKALGNFGLYVLKLGKNVLMLAGAFKALFSSTLKFKMISSIWGFAKGALNDGYNRVASFWGIETTGQEKSKSKKGKKGKNTMRLEKDAHSGGSFIGKLAPWLAIGSATVAYGTMVYNAVEKIREATRIHEEWNKKVYDTNYLTEGLSYRERYLKLSYDTQLDINAKTEEYLRLRKEELGMISEAAKEARERTMGQKYKESLDSTSLSFWNRLAGVQEAPLVYESLAKLKLPYDIKKRYSLQQSMSGGIDPTLSFSITKDGKPIATSLYQKDIYTYDAGYTSPEAAEIVEEFRRKMEQDPGNTSRIYKMLLERIKEYSLSITGDITNKSFNELRNLPLSDMLKTQMGFEGFKKKIMENFFGSSNENAKSIVSLYNLNNIKGKWSTDDQLKFFGSYGIPALLNQDGSNVSLDELRKRFSFDSAKNDFVDFGSKFAIDYAKEFSLIVKDIVDIMARFPEKFRSKFTLLSEPIFTAALKQSNFDNNSNNSSNMKLINGKWHEFITDGVSAEGGHWVPVTDPLKIPTGSGPIGGNQLDYQPKYKSTSAAPKQIIVKIENLMNVETVDLSNPNNVAAVDNIKEQLSQALIDVVHDFDTTFHG